MMETFVTKLSNQSAQRRRVGAYESTFLQFVCVFSYNFVLLAREI